jgi:flagellar protein FliS
VRLCYEQLIGSLGSAIMAASRADNQAKSQALTRALRADGAANGRDGR